MVQSREKKPIYFVLKKLSEQGLDIFGKQTPHKGYSQKLFIFGSEVLKF